MVLLLNAYSSSSSYPGSPTCRARTVVFLAPASELFARYYEFCAPLVFGAELACNPDYGMKSILPEADEAVQQLRANLKQEHAAKEAALHVAEVAEL